MFRLRTAGLSQVRSIREKYEIEHSETLAVYLNQYNWEQGHSDHILSLTSEWMNGHVSTWCSNFLFDRCIESRNTFSLQGHFLATRYISKFQVVTINSLFLFPKSPHQDVGETSGLPWHTLSIGEVKQLQTYLYQVDQ